MSKGSSFVSYLRVSTDKQHFTTPTGSHGCRRANR